MAPTATSAAAGGRGGRTGRRETWRRTLGLPTPWRGTLALVALLVLVAACLELVPPLVVRRLVDHHLAAGDPNGLLTLALVYLAASAATEAVAFLYAYLTSIAAQGALHGLRLRLFEHLQRLPLSYYDRTPL